MVGIAFSTIWVISSAIIATRSLISGIYRQTGIHHETVWGVADEDGLGILMDECDASYKNGKPFLTT